ncbi:MAG: DUF1501 domain-containing protein [Verrucomicrobiota bacterium]
MNMQTLINRRTFLRRSGVGLGSMALSSLLGHAASADSVKARDPKVKRVIFLCMAGGPSHLETFDYKPKLAEMSGQPMPESYTKGQPIAQLQGKQLKCQGPMIDFQAHGQSGIMVSDYLPWTAKIADEIAVIKSMHTTQINHDPAHTVMNSGTAISGRPSMGSWINYGLGSEAENLPGFVVLTSAKGRNPQPIASRQWHSGFLPGRFQGVEFHSSGDPVHYVGNPPGVSRRQQRALVDTVRQLDQWRNQTVNNPDIATRITQYELAFQMQASVPGLMDLSDEPKHILDMYGTGGADGSYAANCLLARRLAERGVRFIQLYHRGWDHHGDLDRYMKICCEATDKATAALVMDLKQRGMLEDTLIVWGGEFGRTPMFQGKGKNPGRDHHIKGFSMWLAGGGVKGGVTHGETDELGYNAAIDRVSVHDLHATILHLLGIDHASFTYQFQGLDFRLTGVEPARPVRSILTS